MSAPDAVRVFLSERCLADEVVAGGAEGLVSRWEQAGREAEREHYPFGVEDWLNELDGRHCGAGNYDFKPVFEALRRRGYAGWISLEAFDFTPGAERLANESLRHLESEIAQQS